MIADISTVISFGCLIGLKLLTLHSPLDCLGQSSKKTQALLDKTGRAFLSVFLVKHRFISISPEQDIRHPVRRSAHLLANHIQVNIRTAFDDQLIMNVTDDEAVPESLHGVTEDVTADGLDDVLHELRTVGFWCGIKKVDSLFSRIS